MPKNPTELCPLQGIRVLDLSRYLPGPHLARILADLGARVVKLEALQGDPTRYFPPHVGEVSAAYAGLNFGKRAVALDLKRPEGLEVALGLAKASDVVVETYRPGVLDRLGFGYEVLATVNPRIILCSISGYGQSGPSRDEAGHDVNYAARAGLLAMQGPAEQAPAPLAVQVADVAGGSLTGAIGVLAAILERERTGRGRHLDISMTRSILGFLSMEAPRRAASTPEPRGQGMLTGGAPCYRIYATKDGRFMALGALEPKFFATFCRLAGVDHLALEGFTGSDKGAQVVEELEALFRSKTQEEWVEQFHGHDTCCSPVRTPEEALADPGVGASTVDAGGVVALLGNFGAPPPLPAHTHVPALGDHGRAVARELGVAEDTVERAIRAGAMLPGRTPEA